MSEFERELIGSGITASESAQRTGIPMYHVEDALKDFTTVLEQRAATDAEFDPHISERTSVLQDVLESFTLKETENFRIFRTQDGIAFPVTSIDITAFAKEMYHKYHPGHEFPPTQSDQQSPKIEEEFIFGPFNDFTNFINGHPFNTVEEAMRQTIRGIGTVIKDLEAGREPTQRRVTTFGAPVNGRWGEITPEYAEQLIANPYGTLAKTYTEAIAASLQQYKPESTQIDIRLYGQSMGGVVAGKTGQELVKQQIATQDAARRKGPNALPSLHVFMDSAPGMYPSHIGKMHIPVGGELHMAGGFPKVASGFIKDIAMTYRSVKDVPKNERAFLDAVQHKLETRTQNPVFGLSGERRIEQNALKAKPAKAIVLALGETFAVEGQPIHADMRYGTRDSISNEGFRTDIRRRYRAGEWPVKTVHNIRRWPIKGERHVLPWFHRTEMNAWTRSIDILTDRGTSAQVRTKK